MPPVKLSEARAQARVEQTIVDDETGDFLSSGDVVFTLPTGETMSVPFKNARTRADAINQAASTLETRATHFLALARSLLQG